MPEQAYIGNGGVGLLVDLTDGDPVVVHWGRDLGAGVPDAGLFTGPVPHSMFDVPIRPSLLPQLSRGWRGRPAVRGTRGGQAFSPRLELTRRTASSDTLRLELADAAVGVSLVVDLRLDQSGLLLVTSALTNSGDGDYALERLDVALPVPASAVETLDTSGRALREKHPQRRPLQQGTWVRSGRHGRTGHDAAAVVAAGTAGFGWATGEVWAIHLGWSGGHETFAERLSDGQAVLGTGELLEPGEVVLGPGETYTAPVLYASWSDRGLDGVSARFHAWMRARPTHPSTPRPVVLNTWEAVYFAHDLAELTALADTAAAVGVERFVLDDGWFRGRRNDFAGLGDWTVDETVWPGGLGPLIDHVRGLGMQFGLWVEPEMVNEDSEVIRAHPDWISGPAGRTPLEWRHQQVIDLVNPGAFAHVLDSIDALLTEYPIAYLKWDQNRDQLELGHDGAAAQHAQTLAAYRLFDELRARHPQVEIESCSSGGARVDLGILQRTDRLWASDTNDALERQTIARWTELIVPPELVGAHVGPPTAHTTGRTHALSFRAATALFGHFGIEWDIRTASDAGRTELARWIQLYKRERGLIHSGRMVRAEADDPACQVTAVVAEDGSRALVSWTTLATSAFEVPARVRIAGLDPDRAYRVTLAMPLDPGSHLERVAVPWIERGEAVASGLVLGTLGLPMPILNPEHAVVLLAEAVA